MRKTDSPVFSRPLACLAATAALLAVAIGGASVGVTAQTVAVEVPDLVGVWDGGGRVRRVNGPNMPWTSDNFPVLNERALAFQEIFDEAIAPKYDCVPSTSPALQYDPYFMEAVQWPDRVLFRYEKDDQLRTVWLDGREPPPNEFSVQGFSVGRYEGDALIVETIALRLRYHRIRRLQRDPVVPAQEGDRAVLARWGRVAHDPDCGGPVVPEGTCFIHDTLAPGPRGLQAQRVRM